MNKQDPTRRDVLKGIGAGTVALVASNLLLFQKTFAKEHRTVDSTNRKLNVVFILIDDMGWMDTGYQGSEFYRTPNIDKLASQGMRFTDAYATCPVCSPTRASCLTGRYPATVNLTDYIPGGAYLYAKLTVPKFNQWLPTSEFTIARALKEEGYATACIGKWHLGRHEYDADNDAYGFDHVVSKGKNNEDKQTSGLVAEGCKFIEANRDKPFFLFLSHYAVHLKIQARPDVVEKYKLLVKGDSDQNNPAYAAMIEHLDDSIGTLMDKLDELNLTDNTMVIFFSDNGGLLIKAGVRITSNAPLRGGKGMLYEGGIREPMIVRLPGIVQQGSVCNETVTNADFFPTILEATGVKVDLPNRIDGVSLVPLLKGKDRLDERGVYWHYPHYHVEKPSGAVRRGDWKLIEFYEDGRLELYNLKDDIGENINLAEKNPDIAAALRKDLGDWRKSVGAQMPTPNPNYDPAFADSDPKTPEELEAWRKEIGAQPKKLK